MIALLILAMAAGAGVGVVYAVACQVRNYTSVHDLKVRVAHLRADYERRKREMTEIIAEPVEDGVVVVE